MPIYRFLWLCLPLVLCCTPTQAHEFWIVPHDAVTHSGAMVVFELRIGPNWPGLQSARLPGLFSSFVMRDSDGTQTISGRDGAMAVGHVQMRQPGAAVVALRTNPARLTLPGTEFEPYLSEEGLDDVLAFRHKNGMQGQPGRELFSRSAKAIILVDGQSDGYDRLLNLPLELIPLNDPLQFKPMARFSLRLMLNGQPLPKALVKAQLKADIPVELGARTDSLGVASFVLPSSGIWLFNAVHMESSMEAVADWESIWASLTIALQQR